MTRHAVVPASFALLAGLLSGCVASAPEEEKPGPVLSPDDARVNEARYQCMLDQGIPVTRTEQGGVAFVATSQEMADAFAEAEETCRVELVQQGLVPMTTPEMLKEEHRVLAALHTCLVEEGFPLVAWPSEGVFVDAGGAFNVLEATAPVEPDDARAACPAEFAEVDTL